MLMFDITLELGVENSRVSVENCVAGVNVGVTVDFQLVFGIVRAFNRSKLERCKPRTTKQRTQQMQLSLLAIGPFFVR